MMRRFVLTAAASAMLALAVAGLVWAFSAGSLWVPWLAW